MIRYCVDLDGTLCTKPKEGYHLALPIKERIDKINSLYEKGHAILIDSARGSMTGINWLEFTKKQLAEWGVKYHALRTGVKFFADYYIDDFAINCEDYFNEHRFK